jgi:predicted site-specific integrase-resolvase
MPVEIAGTRYYRTNEALQMIGISKATWFRWLKEKKVEDVRHKDVRGWRLYTDEDIERIRTYANTVLVIPVQEELTLE